MSYSLDYWVEVALSRARTAGGCVPKVQILKSREAEMEMKKQATCADQASGDRAIPSVRSEDHTGGHSRVSGTQILFTSAILRDANVATATPIWVPVRFSGCA